MKAVTAAIALATALLVIPMSAAAETPCLRTDDPLLMELVTRGLSGSNTFRRLYERLEQSNLIVHLRLSTKAPHGSAYNQFITYAGSYRFVRITLNVSRIDDDAVALLGHELHHAVELAEAPAVEDGDDYERLYERIGYQSCTSAAPRCYETDGAVKAGRRVQLELRKKPMGVAAAVAAAHLIRRWMAQVGGFAAEAEEAP